MAAGTVGFVTKYRGSGEHFRSLHAWLGGAVLILYALQYGAGACAYLLGGVSDRTKVRLLPVHVFMGLLTSTLGVLAICMGIVSQQHFEQEISLRNLQPLSLNIVEDSEFLGGIEIESIELTGAAS